MKLKLDIDPDIAAMMQAWAGQRADIPAGAAGETAQTARFGTGCGKGGRVRAQIDCREMGGSGVNHTREIPALWTTAHHWHILPMTRKDTPWPHETSF